MPCQQQRNRRPWHGTSPQGLTDVAGVCNREMAQNMVSITSWGDVRHRTNGPLPAEHSTTVVPYYFCALTTVSLLHLQLKSDLLMLSEQLGNVVRMDGNIPEDLLKRARQPTGPGRLTHFHIIYSSTNKAHTLACSGHIVLKNEKWVVWIRVYLCLSTFFFLNSFVKHGSFWALPKIMTHILHLSMLALQENNYPQGILIKVSL